jgi:hypothetical protein
MNTMNTTHATHTTNGTNTTNTTNTTLVPTPTSPDFTHSQGRASRFVRVVADPQSYRNITYLLIGLPLGTAWFSLLVSGVAIGASMLVVALLGIPILLGMWYVVRAAANVERVVANGLLGTSIPLAAWGAPSDRSGSHTNRSRNPWQRLRRLSADPQRWREAAFLLLRLPAGIATSTAAVTALVTPIAIAYAPFAARFEDDQPFGDWAFGDRFETIFNSSWAWGFVPAGILLLVAAVHMTNAMAGACGRWATRALD